MGMTMTLAMGALTLLALAGRAFVAPTSATAAGATNGAVNARSAAGPTAPPCQPPVLNRSAALAKGGVTVSPAPDSRAATAQTQISFLGPPAGELRSVRVSGSRSGSHTGRLLAYSQNDGASFVPDAPFTPGETVTVRARLRTGKRTTGFGWRFEVRMPAPNPAPAGHHRAPSATAAVQHFHSAPQLEPPTVTVTTPATQPAPGYLFLSPEQPPVQSGPMIIDDNGELVWFAPLGAGEQAQNLAVQSYLGQPVLTYWERVERGGAFVGQDEILDEHYQTIAQVSAGNGIATDTHELTLTPRGTALLTANESVLCDLAPVGGPADGAALAGVVQEIDVKTGLVMMQWCALDHVPLSSARVSARPTSATTPFDPFHLNSIATMPDGSLVISARNTWAVYDVNARTGQIRWRFGGPHSSFRRVHMSAPAFQHDVRPLSGDEFTVFDNGGSPFVHPQSRGLVLRLNLARHTATVVHSFKHHSPSLRAGSQGSVEAFAPGRYLIGWGQAPYFSEYDSSGHLLFDAHLPPGEQLYRVLRFPWEGSPAQPPAAALSPSESGRVTVWASWNGATGVQAWRVLEGSSTGTLQPVADSSRTGFETAIDAPAPSAGEVVVAQALGSGEQVLGSSPPIGSGNPANGGTAPGATSE
jgi:Arylsulfotransferase (ASST)